MLYIPVPEVIVQPNIMQRCSLYSWINKLVRFKLHPAMLAFLMGGTFRPSLLALLFQHVNRVKYSMSRRKIIPLAGVNLS